MRQKITGRFSTYAVAGLIWLLFLSLPGCYEPQEGCLDTDAVNYQVDADDPCGDCCTFPVLSLQIQHRFELDDTTLNVRYETFYPSTVNPLDSFVLDRFRFFISNVELIRENGELVRVRDSIIVESPAGTPVSISDSFAKVDRDLFQARTLGTIITDGTFTGVRFTLGLEETLLEIDPTSAPSGHPLNVLADTIIYDEQDGITPNLLLFRTDTVPAADSMEIKFVDPVDIMLPIADPFEIDRGFDISLTLRLDYRALFDGVDFQNDSLQTIKQKINDNFGNAFTVSEIKLE